MRKESVDMISFDVNKNEEKKETPKPTPMNPAAAPRWSDPVNVVKNMESAENTPKMPSWNENASVPIRKTMTDVFGVDNEKIGYKDGWVLLDGKEFVRAENNKDGTTYVSSEESFSKGFGDYAQKNNVVAVRDYVTSSGTAANISFNAENGTVSINGKSVKPLYILNGKAYMPKSELDAILSGEINTSGTSYKNIYDGVSAEYDPGLKKAYNKYMNSEEFSYNPDDDPAYQAYKKAMEKAAREEYDNNTAAARFRTGGVASTGAMQTAAAIREDAMDDVKAARAEFEQRAYQRYLDNLALERGKVELAEGLKADEYGVLSGVNGADKNDRYYAESFDNERYYNDLDMQYAPERAEMAIGTERMAYDDTKRNYEISQKFAPVLAELEVSDAIINNLSTRENLIIDMTNAGYSEEKIKEVLTLYDAWVKKEV